MEGNTRWYRRTNRVGLVDSYEFNPYGVSHAVGLCQEYAIRNKYLSLSIYLSIYLSKLIISLCLSVCLSAVCLSVCLSLSFYLSKLIISLSLSLSLSLYLSIYLSALEVFLLFYKPPSESLLTALVYASQGKVNMEE